MLHYGKSVQVHLLASLLVLPAGGGIAAATDSSAFDGRYNGTSRLVAGDPADCQPGGAISVTVAGSRFHFPWRPRQDAMVSIGHDGKYSAMLQGSFVASEKHMQVLPEIDGHADGRALTGEYGTRWCKYTYQLERS